MLLNFITMIKLILMIMIVLSTMICKSQVVIDKAGDGWDLRVDSALSVIKQTDTTTYKLILIVCDKITFWSGNYSTNEGSKDTKGSIIISSTDAKAQSLNNIAAVIVHESLHLYFRYRGVRESPREETLCYSYEYNFLRKIPNIEYYLLEHCLKQINLQRN
jgi:hypothetical protein